MSRYSTQDIRNIAITGHASSGKTTLTEALLHAAGAIATPGSLERGSMVADFEPEEREYGHSLAAAICHFEHEGRRVNVIDTPGSPEFIGHALSVLPAVETVAVVVDAQNGVQMTTTRMMTRAAERKQCRMIIVNKTDLAEGDLAELVESLRETFGRECVPINLPADGGARVVDCFFNPDGEADFSTVHDAHTEIIERVVELDEALMMAYLEQGEVSPQELHDPFEKALREGHLVPICFVSARTGAGIAELLSLVAKLMPNPNEANPRPFVRGTGPDAEPVAVVPDPDAHVVAHVFKVAVDPFIGRLSVFRIHQGTVKKNSSLYLGSARKPIRIAHLLELQGKKTTEIDVGIPGDICALTKVEEVYLDAVLHDSHEQDEIHLRPIELPTPMVGLAVESTRVGDQQKVSLALHKITAEDPCLVIEHSDATHETVLRGLGDLHLRVALEKMKARYGAEVSTRPPRIPYRETISANAEGHHRHKKQTGGAGQFGEVYLRIEALPRGAGFEFKSAVVGGTIPAQFIPAIEKGVRQVLERGPIAGYPMQDVKVVVYDGKYHSVDSKEVAFVAAGKKAFIDAVLKASPVALEPIVDLEVRAPSASMGDVAGDLSSKRGRIVNTQNLPGGMVCIRGQAPLKELGSYLAQLKSMTSGRGTYLMEFSHYDPLPANLQQELVEEFRADHVTA